MKLVHSRTDAPRQLSEECRQLIEKLREMADDIMAMPNPFVPDDPPPTPSAPGQRITRMYDELAEQTEAAERKTMLK